MPVLFEPSKIIVVGALAESFPGPSSRCAPKDFPLLPPSPGHGLSHGAAIKKDQGTTKARRAGGQTRSLPEAYNEHCCRSIAASSHT